MSTQCTYLYHELKVTVAQQAMRQLIKKMLSISFSLPSMIILFSFFLIFFYCNYAINNDYTLPEMVKRTAYGSHYVNFLCEYLHSPRHVKYF